MRWLTVVGWSLLLLGGIHLLAEKAPHEWRPGTVLDENRARYFAGMLNNSSTQTTENGNVSATANSHSIGDSTSSEVNGSYSGTRNSSTSGSSIAIYRVYDNLVIEGEDSIFITSERLRWRWSKGAHVAVNGAIRYYVDGRKLHVKDDDNKEHTIEILKEIRKAPRPSVTASAAEVDHQAASPIRASESDPSVSASVAIESAPTGADISIDGGFVGNTPSTISVAPGTHEVTLSKKGYADWSRKLNVTGGKINLNADLDTAPPGPVAH